jgi:hypothetical protein
MDDFIVEFESGYEFVIQAINQQDAAISAERYMIETGQNNGPIVNVRLV